jgi:PadR family transcriptional regulator, regulatory protein PadR
VYCAKSGAGSYCAHRVQTLVAIFFDMYYIAVMTGQPLGEFEQIVILAILRLEDRAYGVSIREEIRLRVGRIVSPGALYTTLDRLEKKGLLVSHMGDPTMERGGRAKRFYAVTSGGKKRVAAAQKAFRQMLLGLEFLGGMDA